VLLIVRYKLHFLAQLLYRSPEISLLVGGRIQQHCILQENTMVVKLKIKLHIVAPTNLLLQITQNRLVSLDVFLGGDRFESQTGH